MTKYLDHKCQGCCGLNRHVEDYIRNKYFNLTSKDKNRFVYS